MCPRSNPFKFWWGFDICRKFRGRATQFSSNFLVETATPRTVARRGFSQGSSATPEKEWEDSAMWLGIITSVMVLFQTEANSCPDRAWLTVPTQLVILLGSSRLHFFFDRDFNCIYACAASMLDTPCRFLQVIRRMFLFNCTSQHTLARPSASAIPLN